MHHARIDYAQCPGWDHDPGCPAGPEAVSARLDDGNRERFMHVGGENEVTIVGK